MFSLESPHRGDSNENTNMQKITRNYPKYAATGFLSKGIKNEFETAVVNESSVFEPQKCYCNMLAHFVKVHKKSQILFFFFRSRCTGNVQFKGMCLIDEMLNNCQTFR